MLSEQQKQLLTGYLDGELSTRQRKLALRLLKKSPEARALLLQLEQDSHSLIQLPSPGLEEDLSGSVLDQIHQRKLTPRKKVLEPEPTMIAAWFGVAVAASVLAIVGLASYFFFAIAPERTKSETPIVKSPNKESIVASKEKPKETPNPEVKPKNPTPTPEDPRNPGGTVVVEKPDPPTKPENPRVPENIPKKPDYFADKTEDRYEMKLADVLLPGLFGLHHLDREPARLALEQHLGEARGFRVELPCRNGAKSLELLQKVLAKHDVKLILEPVASKRLEKASRQTSFLVYLDNLTPEKLTTILSELGVADRANFEKRPSSRQFTQVVLSRLSRMDVQELEDHSGANLLQRPSNTKEPSGVDIRRPLSEQTAKQVARALEEGRTSNQPKGNFGLTLVYNLARVSPPNKTVRQYRSRQVEPEKDALQVLLVLRATN